MQNTIYQKSNSRRHFIRNSSLIMAGIGMYGLSACSNSSKIHLNVIAYNVLKCTGYPPDNVKDKKKIPDLIAQELLKYSPGIINFSESPEESTVKYIADLLGMNYVFFPSAGHWPGAILTHFEITDFSTTPIVSGSRPEDLFTRHWGKATIKLSNGNSIIVNSVHLYPHDNPVSAEIRKREISEILKSAKIDIEKNKSVLVIGDLNHTPDMPEYLQWMDAGFTDSYIAEGKGDGLTIRANEPIKRIDYILAHGSLSENIVESRALFEGAFRTDPSDPNSFALSDHLPQYTSFQTGGK
jgi:endonuclease/exonuclease/phosphatase family metal-dependent hydrolase